MLTISLRHLVLTIGIPLLVLCGSESARPATIYVDNRHGNDAFDGLSQVPIDGRSGPVRSLRRAAELATPGSTIILADNPLPYFGTLELVGPRHSGSPARPFTLVGNGAVISGAQPVPPRAWEQVGEDLWKVTPWRKGHYQLLLNGSPVPEHTRPSDALTLPEIPRSQWCAWKGSIYYRSVRLGDPRGQEFWFAEKGVGLTLFNVRDVEIRNVTFRHFRLDGINAHDLCHRVTLNNVRLDGNGRAGLAVGGTSDVVVRNSAVEGNRRHSVLITEFGTVELVETAVGQPPTVRE